MNRKQVYSNWWRAIRHDWILILCLLLSVSAFIPYTKFFILPAFIMISQRYRIPKQCKNIVLWLIFFSFVYVIAFSTKGLMTSTSDYVAYLFPPLFYIAGAYIGDKYKYNEDSLVLIVFLILLSYAAVRFALLLYFIFQGEEFLLVHRAIEDASGNDTGGATLYAVTMSVLIVGMSFVFMPAQRGVTWWLRIGGIVLALLATWGMARTVTRTSVLEAALALVVSFFTITIERGSKRRVWGLMIGLFLIIVVAYILLRNSNFFDVAAAFEAREVDADSSFSSGGGRFVRWSAAVSQILTHPFGTDTGRIGISGMSYAHNMWLDLGLTTGWLPFIVLIVLTIKNGVQSYRVWRDRRDYQYFTRLYVFALFVMFFVGCMVEPVCEGMYSHFLVYLLFCGLVSRLVMKKKIN